MASCKECIGYKFCSRDKNGLTNFYGVETACNNVEYLCNDFANKSNFQLVKRGKWIEKEIQGVIDIKTFETLKHFFCSICDKDNKQSMNNYCSNCGAKMDGGKNE